jgi:hypothetical protein
MWEIPVPDCTESLDGFVIFQNCPGYGEGEVISSFHIAPNGNTLLMPSSMTGPLNRHWTTASAPLKSSSQRSIRFLSVGPLD